MNVEPPRAPPLVLHPPRVPPEARKPIPVEIGIAVDWALLALVLAGAFGLIFWLAGDLAWGLLALLVFLPRFLESLLVLGAIFAVALISPVMDWLGSELAVYWPLVLAALVPLPLALLVEAVFFRR